jgi:Methyltransferase domain
VETFNLTSADRYYSDYGRLGDALGVAGATPAPGEVEFLARITSRDWRGIGMLAPSEIFLTAAVTSILGPSLAIEIGTASGFSAAIIAKMIALRQTERGSVEAGPLVHTIDKKADFVFDRAQPIGFAIDLLTPELRDRIALHPLRDSSFCESLTSNGELRFAFVDGSHQHPWPLTDVLCLQRLMESGWILMHDIDLPATIARSRTQGHGLDLAPAFGAKHVFDFWPDKRIAAGNIGAVKIPRDRRLLDELVAQLKELPSEVSVGSWTKQWRGIEEMRTEFAGRG